MIPNSNTAFQVLQPDTSSINFRIANFKEATQDLINAVAYANENEMAMLVDRAISNGAKINYYEFYENHLMVIAVRERQMHAVPILTARGLLLPDVPENGINLLMEAAAEGYEELIDPLIKIAGMDVFSTDSNGKTALHHAAIGDSHEIVKILLDYSAVSTVYTSHMDDAELCSLFGTSHNLTGVNITPLMIASAIGNHKMVSHLLAAGAYPTHGECLPLALACKKGHAPTIKLLLAHQTQPKFSTKEEHTILSIALKNGASLECLRLIVTHHSFDDDDGTTNSPLGLAIQSKQASSVALLLASGAPINKFHAQDNTLWDEAFLNESKPWELLDLLVTTTPVSIISSSDNSDKNFLILFFDNCQNPIPLAALGFYPSVVESSRDALQRLHSSMQSFTQMEKKLLTAFILSINLEKLPDEINSESPGTDYETPESQWLKMTSAKKIEQKNLLICEVNKFIDMQLDKLKYTLSVDFFLDCIDSYPEKRSLKNFILNKLVTEIGIPNQISQTIAGTWSQAAQWSIDWHVASDSIQDANRFLSHLAKNLFSKNFSLQDFLAENFQTKCTILIIDELSKTTHPLQALCINPVAWLRKFENRSNLRNVDEHGLAMSMQIELGLPIVTCQAISNAWSATIKLARKSAQWKSTAELDRFLASVLAPLMEECMSDEFAQRIVPDDYLQNLSLWVTRIRNQSIHVHSHPGSLKRPHADEPDGAPPKKQARL